VASSAFEIRTGVSLLVLRIERATEGREGALLSWDTEPAPADLAGFRVERRSDPGDWVPVAALGPVSSYRDPAARFGDRYRLTAVNGLGEEMPLGEGTFVPARPLAAWPLPVAGGEVQISFVAAAKRTDVTLYDATGRLVRRIASGELPSGPHLVHWDGRDEGGRRVGSGVYFLQHRSGEMLNRLKITVLR
jgi:hypothetical protein